MPQCAVRRRPRERSRFSHICVQTAPPIQATGGTSPESPRSVHPKELGSTKFSPMRSQLNRGFGSAPEHAPMVTRATQRDAPAFSGDSAASPAAPSPLHHVTSPPFRDAKQLMSHDRRRLFVKEAVSPPSSSRKTVQNAPTGRSPSLRATRSSPSPPHHVAFWFPFRCTFPGRCRGARGEPR